MEKFTLLKQIFKKSMGALIPVFIVLILIKSLKQVKIEMDHLEHVFALLQLSLANALVFPQPIYQLGVVFYPPVGIQKNKAEQSDSEKEMFK